MLNAVPLKAWAHYAIERSVARFKPLSYGDVEPASLDVFFVVGHGRSGTQFLAHLLDRAKDASVAHEPCRADVHAAQRARLDPAFAATYVTKHRRHVIVEAAVRARPGRYGEVNSRLRHFIEPLQRTFPNAPMLRLVRDGRDVVRSMLARDRWMIDGLAARAEYLTAIDPVAAELPNMDDFARACWYWRFDTRRSAAALPDFVRFEDFVRDPDYLLEHVVAPLRLELDRSIVVHELAAPKNATQQHVVHGWSDWSSAQRATFWRLCGEVMEQHGYRSA